MAKWGTKKPPEIEGRYWITYTPFNQALKDLIGNRLATVADRHKGYDGRWHWINAVDKSLLNDSQVIAWMKLPSPYDGKVRRDD